MWQLANQPATTYRLVGGRGACPSRQKAFASININKTLFSLFLFLSLFIFQLNVNFRQQQQQRQQLFFIKREMGVSSIPKTYDGEKRKWFLSVVPFGSISFDASVSLFPTVEFFDFERYILVLPYPPIQIVEKTFETDQILLRNVFELKNGLQRTNNLRVQNSTKWIER